VETDELERTSSFEMGSIKDDCNRVKTNEISGQIRTMEKEWTRRSGVSDQNQKEGGIFFLTVGIYKRVLNEAARNGELNRYVRLLL
jgi:hypothetical protein